MSAFLNLKKIYFFYFYSYQYLFFYKDFNYNYFGYFFYKYHIFFRFPKSLVFDVFLSSLQRYNLLGFLFLSKKHIIRLKNLNFLSLNKSISSFFSFVEVFGRNYRFIINKNFLIIFLGFCHYFYIKLPKEINVNLVNDGGTEIVIWSFFKSNVIKFSFLLRKLYKKDIYKGKGLVFNGAKVRLKRKKKKEFL